MSNGSGRLEGVAAVVTGATSGIGAAVVRRFVAEGAAVVAMARREPSPIADEAATFIACDVADEGQVERAFTQAHERLGPLGAVVLNAGVSELDPDAFADLDPTSFRRQWEVNAMGVLHGVRSAPASMRDAGSITITSTAELAWPLPGYLAYSASKAPLAAIVAHAAMQLGARGIRVNSVSPGTIVTPMQSDDDAEAQIARTATCLGRTGTTEDVAGAFVFLASDDARYITATDLRVDGGWIGGLTPAERARLLAGPASARPGASG